MVFFLNAFFRDCPWKLEEVTGTEVTSVTAILGESVLTSSNDDVRFTHAMLILALGRILDVSNGDLVYCKLRPWAGHPVDQLLSAPCSLSW